MARIAFIVSTKVSKKATERNRIRRRLREAFRAHQSIFPGHTDIVIIGKRETLRLPMDDLLSMVATALNHVS